MRDLPRAMNQRPSDTSDRLAEALEALNYPGARATLSSDDLERELHELTAELWKWRQAYCRVNKIPFDE